MKIGKKSMNFELTGKKKIPALFERGFNDIVSPSSSIRGEKFISYLIRVSFLV